MQPESLCGITNMQQRAQPVKLCHRSLKRSPQHIGRGTSVARIVGPARRSVHTRKHTSDQHVLMPSSPPRMHDDSANERTITMSARPMVIAAAYESIANRCLVFDLLSCSDSGQRSAKATQAPRSESGESHA